MSFQRFLDSRLWKLFCSLKLTIVLASIATLLGVGGSILMPFNPDLFGDLDAAPLNLWLLEKARQAPELSWWIPVAGVFVVLLAVNTLCCFLDWLFHLRSRWRKTGEYLIHLGFVLILIAFLWGSQGGFRSRTGMLVGQMLELQQLGVVLKLEEFKPVLTDRGRPIDMYNVLALYRNGEQIKKENARFNHPLTFGGLVVLPSSYGQTMRGGKRLTYSVLTINYDPGAPLAFAGCLLMTGGVLLSLFSFYRKRKRGEHPDIL
ncbi:ResB-like family protein [Malonomonas rubra DSM 5091]|uniref:ResB-like family protein n=1 Tax=Malonomonas rubra DSM 5091 TaxID=1122189 RepID=A0A1M6LSZ3_MALRU|nr:cytochrome c biogenesis protein ResB [Malonomonas rubra]SHJ74341.1 ResB-like family protein [Malonomonas rubra DSM 5091]